MTQLPQQLINGIWQGAALALFAMGYTLVFGVLNIVNLAHGATFMWGAFFAFLCVTKLHWPLWASIPVAMAGAGLLAVLVDRLAFKPLRSLTAGGLGTLGRFYSAACGNSWGLVASYKNRDHDYGDCHYDCRSRAGLPNDPAAATA